MTSLVQCGGGVTRVLAPPKAETCLTADAPRIACTRHRFTGAAVQATTTAWAKRPSVRCAARV
eukprot:6175005-Pleurochrysis_carterae.AAC.1